MKLDLSFIPQKELIPSLEELTGKNFESPYVDIRKFSDDQKKLNDFIKGRANYIRLENELTQFALEKFKSGDYDLASKCFDYLIKIGSQSTKVKEYLSIIKLKQNNGVV